MGVLACLLIALVAVNFSLAKGQERGYFKTEAVATKWLNDYLAALNDCSVQGAMTQEFSNFYSPTFYEQSSEGKYTNINELEAALKPWTKMPYTIVATGEILSSVGGASFMATLTAYMHFPKQGMASCRGQTFVRVNSQGKITRMRWEFDLNNMAQQLGVPDFVPQNTFGVAFPTQVVALETVKQVFNIINQSLKEKRFSSFATLLSDDVEFYVDQGGDERMVGPTAVQDYMSQTWFQTKEWHLGCPRVVASADTVMFTATAHGIMADNCRLTIPFQGYYVMDSRKKIKEFAHVWGSRNHLDCRSKFEEA
eukprot:m.93904 g.93904  ORF g.93904 m.93904 type:complete len:310 (-) comp21820_c0_seq1:169-1098(-)